MKSLKSKGNQLSISTNQIEILSNTRNILRFQDRLKNADLFPLKPLVLEIFQINIGYMCNQVCEHCHVDAGPDRKEIMTKETMQYCLDSLGKSGATTVDLTGGAPEMNPHFEWFVEELASRNIKIIVRSNLTILVANKKYKKYPEFFKKNNVIVIASLPCYTKKNTDKQRGKGVFNDSIKALKMLNEVGYGKGNSGLELNLVYNPGTASLPPNQMQLEQDYKLQLKKQFNLEFNSLYTITNLPISRFLDYLLIVGKYEQYMDLLANSYNAKAAKSVMCRNTISVSWDGKLFDCDFNQMLEMRVSSKSNTIENFDIQQLNNRNILVNQHCYGCTAGEGSSCQGTLI